MSNYIKFDCPECGAPLEVMADYLIVKRDTRYDCFAYELRDLIRHCESCHSDWVNEWEYEFGDTVESPLRRKYWG